MFVAICEGSLYDPRRDVQKMNNTSQQEKIYRVLDLVAETPHLSQRELASSTGLSLGLINLTLKRLIETGHIKMSNLNSRKVEYVLTPKGLWEKANRTYAYLTRAVQTFKEYQSRIEQLVQDLAREPRCFAIVGSGEIASLTEMALRKVAPQSPLRFLEPGESPAENEILLDCRLNAENGGVGISILYKLLANGGRHDTSV